MEYEEAVGGQAVCKGRSCVETFKSVLDGNEYAAAAKLRAGIMNDMLAAKLTKTNYTIVGEPALPLEQRKIPPFHTCLPCVRRHAPGPVRGRREAQDRNVERALPVPHHHDERHGFYEECVCS